MDTNSSSANWGLYFRRVLAALIDSFLYGIIIFGIIIVMALLFLDIDNISIGAILMFIPIYFISFFIYFIIPMARIGEHNGQTLGKQALDIQVVRLNNDSDIDSTTAFLREFVMKGIALSALSGVTFGIFPIVNYLWPLFDQNNQTLTDKVLNLTVAYSNKQSISTSSNIVEDVDIKQARQQKYTYVDPYAEDN